MKVIRGGLIRGAGIGAALMYFFDPERGARRRAMARDKLNRVTHVTGDSLGSTARDLAVILRSALQMPGMRDILSTRTAVIQPLSGSRKRIALRSTNRLLWRDDIAVIGKTGWTRQAKRCFLGAASAGGREVIVSVLGSSDLWGDVEILANYGLAQTATAARPLGLRSAGSHSQAPAGGSSAARKRT